MYKRQVRSGSRIVVGITAAFPVTISTAIVSPMARPMPRTTPEVIPEMENGITTLYIVCQRVAPNARPVSYTHLDVYKRQMTHKENLAMPVLH